jgi:NDP-sugar pyrophosphorylase family protein
MHAVILAGGKGTRLLPFTKVFPKPLVPIGEKPILDTIIRQLKYFGFNRITLAVGHMAEMFYTFAGNGEQYGIKIDYCYEEEPLGTVGPLGEVEFTEDNFLVMNGDLITNLDFRDIILHQMNSNSIATIGTFKKDFKIELGIINSNDENHIIDYIEKPIYSFNVSMGIYAFNLKILQYIEPKKYLDFPKLVNNLIADNQIIDSYLFEGHWLDIGNHSDYAKATEEYETIKKELNFE